MRTIFCDHILADPRQPVLLRRAAVLHDDRLDDVELDGLRPRTRHHARTLRRLAAPATPGQTFRETVASYTVQVIYWVKGSVHILF